MEKCIGIISYLPNEETTRKERVKLINSTLKKCDELFHLPIIIIAQNWRDEDEIDLPLNSVIYKYDKLGIPLARNTLREKFLESDYEYLIMLDDDCVIQGNNAEEYLKEIDEHPNGFGFMYVKQLKLCAISKHIYSQFECPNVDAEKNEGVEDTIFFAVLKYGFRKSIFAFNTRCISLDLEKTFHNSTWRSKNTKQLEIMINTKKIIHQLQRTNWLLEDEGLSE